jgi:hypothetical protein
VAGAAYRAGLNLTNEHTGERHDYTRKTGVLASGIVAPPGAPAWARDAAKLWNAAEAAETRRNSVVAREFLVSLPHELTEGQRVELARDLTAELVGRFSFAAMFAVHAPDKHADERNHHVHILATTRAMGVAGLGAKTRELDDRRSGAVDEVRDMVATTINRHLEHAGLAARVDHRSLMAQQLAAADAGDFAKAATLERKPEPKVGRAATAAARRGHRSPRAERAQRVRTDNAGRLEAQADRFRELKAQAAAEGRLAQVDEQALHAQALLDVAYTQARKRQAAYQPTTPNRSPHHGPQRHSAPALTGHRVHSRSHPTGRQSRGLEPLPPVRPLDRAATFGQQSGHSGGAGGFAPFPRDVLQPNAPGHNDPNSSLQRLRAARGGLTPRAKSGKPKALRTPRHSGTIAPSSRSRVSGDGTREGERLAQLANLYIAGLEESIAAILRAALKWSQGHQEPIVQRMATHYLNAQGEARVALVAREHVAEQLHAATRQRDDLDKRAKKGATGLKGIDRWAASLGWTPKSLRDLLDAQKQARELVEMVSEADRQVAADAKRLQAEVQRHQDRLLAAYEKSQPATYPTFRNRDQAPEPEARAKGTRRQNPDPNPEPTRPRLRPPGPKPPTPPR